MISTFVLIQLLIASGLVGFILGLLVMYIFVKDNI